jgi:hypothetical protein
MKESVEYSNALTSERGYDMTDRVAEISLGGCDGADAREGKARLGRERVGGSRMRSRFAVRACCISAAGPLGACFV